MPVTVLDRRRLQLCDSAAESAKQPYHRAEPMAFAEAESFIRRCREQTEALARAAIAEITDFAGAQKLALTTCSILSASGRKLPPLKEILASHALIHAAEGEFYRAAVAAACKRAGIAVLRIRERDACRQGADQLGVAETQLRQQLAAIGKALGPPWGADQKLAALAGWIVLA